VVTKRNVAVLNVTPCSWVTLLPSLAIRLYVVTTYTAVIFSIYELKKQLKVVNFSSVVSLDAGGVLFNFRRGCMQKDEHTNSVHLVLLTSF